MTEVFVARQPIFDREKRLYGYELLYRSGMENYCAPDDILLASFRVLSNILMLNGFEKIADGKLAFLNVSREVLVEDFVLMFPKEHVVVELLETIDPDPFVIETCRRLKQLGYTLALDDFVSSPAYTPILELADIV